MVGTEQAGIRPVVILQIDRANVASPHTIIVPFTSKNRRAILASHVFIPLGSGGLTQDSHVPVGVCKKCGTNIMQPMSLRP